jgi:hypothetical protein
MLDRWIRNVMEWCVFPVCSPPDSRGQTEARCPQTPSPPTFSSLKKIYMKKDEKNSIPFSNIITTLKACLRIQVQIL